MIKVAAAMRKAISHSSKWSRNFSIAVLPFFALDAAGRCKNATAGEVRTAVALGGIRQRSGLEAGLLVHGVQNVLADAALVFLVHHDQRLLHRGLLRRRQHEDLGLARLAD